MTYLTYLHITKNHPKWKEILKVIGDIQARDPTFTHHISEAGEIVITSTDKDQAFKRGAWFHHKHGIKYTVLREKRER